MTTPTCSPLAPRSGSRGARCRGPTISRPTILRLGPSRLRRARALLSRRSRPCRASPSNPGRPRSGLSSRRCRFRTGSTALRGGACRAPRARSRRCRARAPAARSRRHRATASREAQKISTPSSPVYPVRATVTSTAPTRPRATWKDGSERRVSVRDPRRLRGSAAPGAPGARATPSSRSRLGSCSGPRRSPREVGCHLRVVRGVAYDQHLLGAEPIDDEVVEDGPALVAARCVARLADREPARRRS